MEGEMKMERKMHMRKKREMVGTGAASYLFP
jgi:hypothetical protein